jgi:hypothetical protein
MPACDSPQGKQQRWNLPVIFSKRFISKNKNLEIVDGIEYRVLFLRRYSQYPRAQRGKLNIFELPVSDKNTLLTQFFGRTFEILSQKNNI